MTAKYFENNMSIRRGKESLFNNMIMIHNNDY